MQYIGKFTSRCIIARCLGGSDKTQSITSVQILKAINYNNKMYPFNEFFQFDGVEDEPYYNVIDAISEVGWQISDLISEDDIEK